MTLVYKILAASAWEEARRVGVIAGSDLDRADETLARHFAGVPGLVLAAFDAGTLGAALRWEPSRGGDLFPHFYGALSVADVSWCAPLALDAHGIHVLPATLK
jgi:uncharacterized protein (DUF952 family)